MRHLPVAAAAEEYEAQAEALWRGHSERDPAMLRTIHEHHPRFLDSEIRWLPLRLTDDEIAAAPFDSADARLALARWYSFRDWDALLELVAAVHNQTPGIHDFELASEAVITGDAALLRELLQTSSGLIRARSSRRTSNDPEVHGATLLHYIAANGIETYRQRTPPNALEIARTLLDAGADPNALAGMYGGECATLPMLVSSSPPAEAGLQTPLTELLLDYGADPNGSGAGKWISPLMTALVFGFRDTAEVLARRGARVDCLAAAAGLGWTAEVASMLAHADAEERQRALALAAQLGHTQIVARLLDAGADPDVFNPDGMHSHSTPLHQAALAGHLDVVRVLVNHGARTDIPDKLWNGTPRNWAEHSGRTPVIDYLRSREL